MKHKVLIIGGAKSGVAVARLLRQHDFVVVLTDQHKVGEKEELMHMGIQVYDEGHPSLLQHDRWDFVVKNPGIPYTAPFVKYFVDIGMQILTEVEIGYRYAPDFCYGAITGTNGKTTITTMLYEMLKWNGRAIVAGNIGWPLSELAYTYGCEKKDVALELSNFQLLGIDTFAPMVSVVCNLAPDHLDYMPSVNAYYESKMRIYKNSTKEDWFLRNVDDALIMRYAQDIPCTIIDFSMYRQDVDVYRKQGKVYFRDECLFNEHDLQVKGMFYINNAMIASCMAYKMGVSTKHIQKVIATFKSVEHRLEYIDEKEGIKFYNDSKATNTHATMAALQSFTKNIILLVGGHDKGIGFQELRQYDKRVKMCIAFGETKDQFLSIFSHVCCSNTMKEAFDIALQHAITGDVVLLSPACASYDQFANYGDRGHQFKEMVMAYVKE